MKQGCLVSLRKQIARYQQLPAVARKYISASDRDCKRKRKDQAEDGCYYREPRQWELLWVWWSHQLFAAKTESRNVKGRENRREESLSSREVAVADLWSKRSCITEKTGWHSHVTLPTASTIICGTRKSGYLRFGNSEGRNIIHQDNTNDRIDQCPHPIYGMTNKIVCKYTDNLNRLV